MDPIRVLWLVKGLGPGGAEQLLLLSAQVTNSERFTYRLCFVRPDKTHLVPEFEAVGLAPQRLGANRRFPLAWVVDLREQLRWADVVHAHSPVLASVARLLTRSLSRKERPAVVVTEHNEWTSHHVLTRLANGLTAPLDAHRWAVSDQVRQTVWASRRSRTEVLIHGINTAAAAPDPNARAKLREELGVGDGEVLALTVGNLRRNKDYPNLLAAAQRARQDAPELRFAAVGQGPLEGEITALHASLGIADRFQLLGFRRDVRELMAAADIFVMGSAHEGLPVVIMEAFAAGLPVVATRVGGVPQQVREGQEGLLVPAGDPESLAQALILVVRDPELRSRLATGAAARAKDYDIRTAVTAQERVYEAVAPGR